MNNKTLLATVALAGFAAAAQANIVDFDFQSNGSNLNLGSQSTFNVSGATLTAYANAGQSLFSKNSGGGEAGLGLADDPTGQHEIYGNNFVQLIGGAGNSIISVFTEDNTASDLAIIYASTTLGSLGTMISGGTVQGLFNIPLAYQNGYYITIANGNPNGNTWVVGSVSVGVNAPDGGSSMILLGSALTAAGLIRRKLIA